MSVMKRDVDEARACFSAIAVPFVSRNILEVVAQKIAEYREKLESWQRSVTMLGIKECERRLRELNAIRKLLDEQEAGYTADVRLLRRKQLRYIEKRKQRSCKHVMLSTPALMYNLYWKMMQQNEKQKQHSCEIDPQIEEILIPRKEKSSFVGECI